MASPLPHLRSIVDHDGAVILDISRNAITNINPTGGYIWQHLVKGSSVETIISELVHHSGLDEDLVSKDLNEFMEDLKSKHLITIS